MSSNLKSASQKQDTAFLSYARDDDQRPLEKPKTRGFVSYLYDQLKWELIDLGLPENFLWRDQENLRFSDNWPNVIDDTLKQCDIMLVVTSRNFAKSEQCQREVELFVQRLRGLPHTGRSNRIFRLEKQPLADNELPELLQTVHAVRFWEKDRETGSESPYYVRGVLKRPTPYAAAIHGLAVSIMKSLEELRQTEVDEDEREFTGRQGESVRPGGREHDGDPDGQQEHSILEFPVPVGQRTVFVAKPASDLLEPYETLVRELRKRHYTVVPDTQSALADEGSAVQGVVRSGLARAELSIHFIGERRGYKPDGLDVGIVALQLAEAAAEAERRPDFHRLIWIPKIVPDAGNSAAGETTANERDPLKILAQFATLLETDELEGDTAARFNEFVIQRLEARKLARPAEGRRSASVYIAAAPVDLKLSVEAGKRLKERGQKVLIFPSDIEYQLASRADHVAFCWGEADEITVMEALDRFDSSEWRRLRPNGKLQLILFEPNSNVKQIAREIESFGAADFVVDSTRLGENGLLAEPSGGAAG
ncbi:MAG TPA: toll/interleukin-1 receptor domain-containing protein [Paraburkholderia sp.]|uniref:toll/interleukin-1 receptor domain-containing protein n=1 Tax=Paraburkholderia sp. TaxID=1926495 RepID=UPI002B97C7D5|nr:toll/interleukin-1 receptor domain-containing protein [Paraburkholderia sp.]HTR10552.1 toll/interleukin-1 receptor domain-containing protein [Paraburkholderia sp.]